MRADRSARRRRALGLLLLLAGALSGAQALGEEGAEPFTAHQAGLLLDRSFADLEACDRALAEARRLEAEEKGRRPEYRTLFAHGRCDLHKGHYAIRMHWPRRSLAPPG